MEPRFSGHTTALLVNILYCNYLLMIIVKNMFLIIKQYFVVLSTRVFELTYDNLFIAR